MKKRTQKRITKKDIYAKYGIEYHDEHIITPNGWKIPPLLINGNEKIGKGVRHFSTLAGTGEYTVQIFDGYPLTVKGTCACNCVDCYGMNGRYKTESVKFWLAIRTFLAREYPDFVYRAILAQIDADKIELVRVHATGDFFSEEYADIWYRIALQCKKTIFWTYTKTEFENYFDDLKNFNVVRSNVPKKGVNYGTCEHVIACYEFLKELGEDVYICRCGIDKEQHCTNCHGCTKNKYVLFLVHGTSYKAEEDPLFPVVKALIESQPKQ